ncbi:MAG: hypothetical protein ACRDJW_20285 [Thermomicrobiales bacterium]
MAATSKVIDVEEIPELDRVAQEVSGTGESLLLRKKGRNLAVIHPADWIHSAGSKRIKTAADLAAFLRTAGGWKLVDTDRLKKDIQESRKLQTRPPVEL